MSLPSIEPGRPAGARGRSSIGATGGRAVAVGAVLAAALTLPARAAAAPIFALADRAALVMVGTVRAVSAHGDGKYTVFHLEPGRVLKGEPAAEGSVALVQEMLFASTAPLFDRDTRTLVFALPLPDYTAYRKALPAGRYVQWAERLDTRAEVAGLSDPDLVEPVARYLAVRDDPEALARALVAMIPAASARLRSDALTALATRPELAPLLDAGTLAPLAPWLAEQAVPVEERARVLVALGRARAAGIDALAAAPAGGDGPLAAAALDALVSAGRLPSEDRLQAATRAPDVARRLAAARGLAALDSETALARLGVLVESDPADAVRLAAIAALGTARREEAVPLLARVLGAGEKELGNAAAEALAAIASPAAVRALGAVLVDGPPDAQAAAAFALVRSGTPEGVAILREQKESHPDPRVQRLCTLALGEERHEH